MFPPYNLYPGPLPHLQLMRPKSNAPSFFLADEIKAELLHRQALTLVQLDPSLNAGETREWRVRRAKVGSWHGKGVLI